MHKIEITIMMKSPLRDEMISFIKGKQACGYRYKAESEALLYFDRFLCTMHLKKKELPRPIVDQWIAKKPHEQPRTHQNRISLFRQFARFLCRQGYNTYIPEFKIFYMNHSNFIPYIFNHEEIKHFLKASDSIPSNPRTPLRHLIVPEVFRLLYCCGMRLNEVLQLRIRDVNLAEGILTVRKGKFKKDRLVPMAHSMTIRLMNYSSAIVGREPITPFFPTPAGKFYNRNTIYSLYRMLLRKSLIRHGGKGKGPRLHDFRHTFAVHRLETWYRQGDDLGNKLPILSTYLGHKNLSGTQWYLRITPEIFPDITQRLEKIVNHIFPGRVQS